jgi:MFS family permease
MLFGMPRALFPQVAQETFGDPPGGGLAIGVLYAALSVGAVLAGLSSGTFTRIRRHGVMVTASVCAWGLAIVGFGLSRWLWLAVCFLALGGAALFILAVFRGTILQAAVTDQMRGRMQGALMIVAAGGPWVSDIVHGPVGATIGTTWAISGGGVLTVAAMLVAVLAFPVLWQYRGAATDTTDDPTEDLDTVEPRA